MKEIWKDIPTFNGNYKASNLGNIKSVKKNLIMKPKKEKNGYLRICLYRDGNKIYKSVHQLVIMAFKNFESDYKNHIDHVNSIKTDNRLSNLKILTAKKNVHKYHLSQNQTSSCVGVCYHKVSDTWHSRFTRKGKRIDLGYFKTEEEAINALKSATNQ